jgi:putative modified peptide
MQLSKTQSSDLMQKLAGDDAFRAQFEKDPAAALLAAGLSKDQVASLEQGCLTRRTLASKDVFERLQGAPESEEFKTAMSFSIHHVKLG